MPKRRILNFIILLLFLTGCSSSASPSSQQTPESNLYIQNKGSDTMVNLALAWAEKYQQDHPDLRISVTGGGTGTGITSLLNGTVDIANASRKIKSEEIETARKIGLEPVEYIVAKDAIAVIVNPNNPITQLTLQQLSDIYSGKIGNWSEVGGVDRPIVRLSRETNSGTHTYFLEYVIRQGNNSDNTIFSPTTLLLPSSEGIIAEVSDNPNAIGYDGLGYITSTVKVLAVADKGSEQFVLPSVDTVNKKQYPISRDLYMYTPGEDSAEVLEYIDWILSADGQSIVQQLGFVPVSSQINDGSK